MKRIYTKPRGRVPDYDAPVVVPSSKCTIEEFCMRIHRSLLEQFKHALVGKNGHTDGARSTYCARERTARRLQSATYLCVLVSHRLLRFGCLCWCARRQVWGTSVKRESLRRQVTAPVPCLLISSGSSIAVVECCPLIASLSSCVMAGVCVQTLIRSAEGTTSWPTRTSCRLSRESTKQKLALSLFPSASTRARLIDCWRSRRDYL